jgi:hypothetical protein
MGRPKLVIDEAQVAELAYGGASVNEIALILGCDDQTLHRRFAKLIAKKKAERRYEIRLAQTAEAKAGSAALLIWLGKVELEQVEHEPTKQPVTIRVEYVDPDRPAAAAPSEPAPA